MFVFDSDCVSSECVSLTSRYLTWHVDGSVDLWCSRVGVVPSVVPANFYPSSGKNPNCGVGPLSRSNPAMESGSQLPPCGGNPISGAVTLGL